MNSSLLSQLPRPRGSFWVVRLVPAISGPQSRLVCLSRGHVEQHGTVTETFLELGGCGCAFPTVVRSTLGGWREAFYIVPLAGWSCEALCVLPCCRWGGLFSPSSSALAAQSPESPLHVSAKYQRPLPAHLLRAESYCWCRQDLTRSPGAELLFLRTHFQDRERALFLVPHWF